MLLLKLAYEPIFPTARGLPASLPPRRPRGRSTQIPCAKLGGRT